MAADITSRSDGQAEPHAWLEYFLPTWAASERGAFQFARASPHLTGPASTEVQGETLVQTSTFSAANESYPAAEVARWAAENPRAGHGHGPEGGQSGMYRPLEDAHDIRVLELLPGTPDEPLRASLHHCSIGLDMEYVRTICPGGRFALDARNPERPVWYTALSYTWGPPLFEATIHCDGHAKAITRTLEAALRHFRHRTDAIILWVDQVCINQDDLDEKKQQIPLMSSIYTRAFNTVIWLGEADASLEGTLDFLNDITIRLQFANEVACPEGLEDVQLPPGDSPLWTDLITFFGRPWFQRLWIIQEVVLSRNSWVMCGRYILPWRRLSSPCTNLKLSGISDWLSTRAEAMRQQGNDAIPLTDGWVACEQLGREQEHHDGEGVTLFSLVRNNRHALCWEPRDKVYGMLALTTPGEAAAVHVDYTANYSFTKLYHDIAKKRIRAMEKERRSDGEEDEGEALVLQSIHQILVQVDGPARTSDGLPSWVPDWSSGRRTTPMAGTLNAHVFHASGASSHRYSLDEGNDAILHLGVGFVDRIEHLTDIFEKPTLSYDDIPGGNQDLLTWFHLCSSLEQYPVPSQTVFDAFWQSMVAGMSETGRVEAPVAFAEIFSVLLDASTGLEPSLAGQSYTARQKRPLGKGKLTPNQLGSRTAGVTFRNARAAMRSAMRNRRLGITEKGYIGLFPGHSTKSDVIHIIGGCPVPYVMREEGNSWHMLGECYIHGIMQGEMLQDGFEWRNIVVE